MPGTTLLKRVGALVVALTAVVALQTQAKPAGAQLGTVSVAGTLVSGGTLSYQFNLTVLTNAGPLVVKATVSGKKFKTKKFPVLTIANPPLGTNDDVQGTFVSIPTNFTGVVTMKVTATFHRHNIGSRKLRATITAELPPSAATTVSTNLYDVGFENPVTLDGSMVPTLGMTGTVTYAWSQTSGKTVALSANGTVTASFTTDAFTNFVDMATTNFVNDIDDQGNTNVLFVPPEHRFGAPAGLSLDNEQASAATYGFQVLVSDGSVTRTGLFTVATSLQTPAQPNIPVGVTAFYKGATNSMNWSLVTKPVGSAAALAHANGLIAALRPDLEGVYVIQDNVTGKSLTNTAASWTGVQFCTICHGPGNNVGQPDIVTPWSGTLHATMAQRGVDGYLAPDYNESCFQCHTVGFNQSPAATNGNFYAVQQQIGWTFPAVLKPGNYALMPAQLQNLANIQCESCHGPGSRHPGAPSVSLDEKVCASCHQDGSFHVFPQQWETSPHAGAYEQISYSEGTSAACANCHSPQGFVDRTKGLSPIRTGTGPATCQVCHDPHNVQGFPEAAHQVRVYDTVTIGDVTKTNGIVNVDGSVTVTNSTVTLTGKGPSAVCMSCHNARALPYQNAGTVGTPKPVYMTSLPHESTVTEVLNGIGGADQGVAMGNSFHTYLAECVDCHMYSAGTNTVGSHTFSMTDRLTGDDDLAACNQCHASSKPVDDFDFVSVNAQDYDGDGTIDGVQTEVQGLLTILSNKFANVGISVSDGYPFINAASYTTVTNQYPSEAAPIRRALWNRVLITREGSFGIHNTQFAVRLLQSSYTDLSTNCIDMTTRTNGHPFQVDYPKAFLR